MPVHNRRDAALTKTKALPAAGATAYTDALDIGVVDASFDHVEIEMALPALPSLADTKNITVSLQDSADGTTFASLSMPTLVVTGIATGQGSQAASRALRLPNYTRRYLRAAIVADATSGDNTAKSLTLSLLT